VLQRASECVTTFRTDVVQRQIQRPQSGTYCIDAASAQQPLPPIAANHRPNDVNCGTCRSVSKRARLRLLPIRVPLRFNVFSCGTLHSDIVRLPNSAAVSSVVEKSHVRSSTWKMDSTTRFMTKSIWIRIEKRTNLKIRFLLKFVPRQCFYIRIRMYIFSIECRQLGAGKIRLFLFRILFLIILFARRNNIF
jgi:hypothetical protein